MEVSLIEHNFNVILNRSQLSLSMKYLISFCYLIIFFTFHANSQTIPADSLKSSLKPVSSDTAKKAKGQQLLLKTQVHFGKNNAGIRPESYSILNATAKYLNDHPTEYFVIVGYASSEGTAAHAVTLSKDRANAVKTYLVNLGISPKRLRIKGNGETDPIADDTSEEGRLINRRVEFKTANQEGFLRTIEDDPGVNLDLLKRNPTKLRKTVPTHKKTAPPKSPPKKTN
ncbi:MAG: OmpA family protein [Mucilaginibacter sp.]|nr:OmpA family protein [Mucilaginibacter sp.]